MRYLVVPLVLAAGCKADPIGTDETGDTGSPPTLCQTLGLSEVPFDTEGPFGTHRWDVVDDFEVLLGDGSTFSLSESWTGCDVVVVVSSRVRTFDGEPYWDEGLDALLAASPRNARYLFLPVRATSTSMAEELASAQYERFAEVLATMSEEDAAWWEPRLMAVPSSSMALDGWFGEVTSSSLGANGIAIDRFQRLRGVGSAGHVEEYDPGAGWFDARLDTLAWEVEYLNFEAERQARLDTEDATVVEGLGGEVVAEYEDFEVTLPGDMGSYDTLEVDVLMECPDPDEAEWGNCGAWDYLAHLWLVEGEGESQVHHEVARFITTYHRESRWVVDASHALPWLAEGGTRSMRYQWAPSWNTQPTGVTLRLRLSDRGKDTAPAELIPLWTGGALDSSYNTEHPPIQVDIPEGAARVELVVLTTGHGADDGNCAEFCDHRHEFSVGEQTWLQEFPAVGDDLGCAATVGTGTVPNQWGTWWLGRGGWCPGRRVDPWVVDLTDHVTEGSTATIGYRALYRGDEITDDSDRGDIVLSSWVLVSR